MKRIKELLKQITKEQIKDFLFVIIAISLFKIAFGGITIYTTEEISVDSYVSGSVEVSGNINSDITGSIDTNVNGLIGTY